MKSFKAQVLSALTNELNDLLECNGVFKNINLEEASKEVIISEASSCFLPIVTMAHCMQIVADIEENLPVIEKQLSPYSSYMGSGYGWTEPVKVNFDSTDEEEEDEDEDDGE